MSTSRETLSSAGAPGNSPRMAWLPTMTKSRLAGCVQAAHVPCAARNWRRNAQRSRRSIRQGNGDDCLKRSPSSEGSSAAVSVAASPASRMAAHSSRAGRVRGPAVCRQRATNAFASSRRSGWARRSATTRSWSMRLRRSSRRWSTTRVSRSDRDTAISRRNPRMRVLGHAAGGVPPRPMPHCRRS